MSKENTPVFCILEKNQRDIDYDFSIDYFTTDRTKAENKLFELCKSDFIDEAYLDDEYLSTRDAQIRTELIDKLKYECSHYGSISRSDYNDSDFNGPVEYSIITGNLDNDEI